MYEHDASEVALCSLGRGTDRRREPDPDGNHGESIENHVQPFHIDDSSRGLAVETPIAAIAMSIVMRSKIHTRILEPFRRASTT
jgi:hypothetical protein